MHEVSRGKIIIGAYETMEQARALLKEATRNQIFGDNSPVIFVTTASLLGIHVMRVAQAVYKMHGKLAILPRNLSSVDLWAEILEEVECLPDDYAYEVTRDVLFVAADPCRANQLLSYFIDRREVSPITLEAGKFYKLKRNPKTTPVQARVVVPG